jgi:hypothetical protein
MKPRIALVIATLACASAAPPQAKQVAELDGRAPGKPQRCVGVPPGGHFETSSEDPHLLLYDDGKTIWASRLDSSCGFGPAESVIPDTAASYYCQGDFVRQGGRIELSPFGKRCALNRFTPYRK